MLCIFARVLRNHPAMLTYAVSCRALLLTYAVGCRALFQPNNISNKDRYTLTPRSRHPSDAQTDDPKLCSIPIFDLCISFVCPQMVLDHLSDFCFCSMHQRRHPLIVLHHVSHPYL